MNGLSLSTLSALIIITIHRQACSAALTSTANTQEQDGKSTNHNLHSPRISHAVNVAPSAESIVHVSVKTSYSFVRSCVCGGLCILQQKVNARKTRVRASARKRDTAENRKKTCFTSHSNEGNTCFTFDW